ncbi:HEPN/Toprim-associated domain-containing protein [Rhodovulum sulfidophilum]|uniref:HEPN/Toprim-associated domain-containing protein n=1 Tax=Rhodovulum sulfidophilum TaxID=35806 RepID=UPI00143B483A
MGTYSDFRIGNFHLESSGNFTTTTHHSIYLPSDSVFVERDFDLKQVEVFQATLRSILPRLELLGSTLPAIERRFNNPWREERAARRVPQKQPVLTTTPSRRWRKCWM